MMLGLFKRKLVASEPEANKATAELQLAKYDGYSEYRREPFQLCLAMLWGEFEEKYATWDKFVTDYNHSSHYITELGHSALSCAKKGDGVLSHVYLTFLFFIMEADRYGGPRNHPLFGRVDAIRFKGRMIQLNSDSDKVREIWERR